MMSYLRQIFTTPAFTASIQTTETAAHALRSGLLFGLGQTLALSAKGQSFLWPYLFGGNPIMPGATPPQWCLCLLGVAIGLAILMRRQWTAVWRNLRGAEHETDTAEWPTLVLAAVPCLLVQWRLNSWGGHFQAAAAIAVFLLLSAGVLRLADRWGQEAVESSPHVPPWLALLGGVAAGFAVLPGLSAVAILLATGLYSRASGVGAGRFALMTMTIVVAVEGLVRLPAAFASWPPQFLPLLVGAAAGAAAGGALLLWLLGAVRRRALPMLISYCTATAGLLLLFGVFNK